MIPIAGIKYPSLVDFPDTVSFTIWTQGCNMNCHYCFNPELIPHNKGNIQWDTVYNTIKSKKNIIQAVVFTGGEPTIHKNLLECLLQIKKLNLLIGLHSNTKGEFFSDIAPHCDYMLLSNNTNTTLCNHIELINVV